MTVPLLWGVVVVLMLLLLPVVDTDDVGLEDVLLEPVVLTEVVVCVLEVELWLVLTLVETEEELREVVEVET